MMKQVEILLFQTREMVGTLLFLILMVLQMEVLLAMVVLLFQAAMVE